MKNPSSLKPIYLNQNLIKAETEIQLINLAKNTKLKTAIKERFIIETRCLYIAYLYFLTLVIEKDLTIVVKTSPSLLSNEVSLNTMLADVGRYISIMERPVARVNLQVILSK